MNNMLPIVIYFVTCLLILGGISLFDKHEWLAISLMVSAFVAMIIGFIISLKIYVAHSSALVHLLQQGVPLFFGFLTITFASWVLIDTTVDMFDSPNGGSDTLLKGVGFILGVGLLGALATWIVYL